MKGESNMMKQLSLVLAGALAISFAARADEEHATGKTANFTGEVLDLACYLDHGASGEKHASCAKTCMESGLPVGLKATDGKTYLLIGEHKPLNKTLAPYAGKTVTVKGKAVSRDGLNMIENAELVK
jgi:hypothetical protein